MSKETLKDTTHNSYVDRVREDTQKYVRQLMSENEQLRIVNAQLQSEIGNVRQELAQRESSQRELAQALEGIREESQQHLARYAEVEMHNANLANLYVASYQLHGTLRRDAVLGAIQEIIVNLVGSEMFAICEVDEQAISVLASVGVDPESIGWNTPRVFETAIHGVPYIGTSVVEHSGERAPGDPLVCLPLSLDGRIVGVIVIFELLAHKPQLEALDHELFDLLATHAATALYCTSLHERSAAVEGA